MIASIFYSWPIYFLLLVQSDGKYSFFSHEKKRYPDLYVSLYYLSFRIELENQTRRWLQTVYIQSGLNSLWFSRELGSNYKHRGSCYFNMAVSIDNLLNLNLLRVEDLVAFHQSTRENRMLLNLFSNYWIQ